MVAQRNDAAVRPDTEARLVEKIMKLPPMRIAQAEDFIDFLIVQEGKRACTDHDDRGRQGDSGASHPCAAPDHHAEERPKTIVLERVPLTELPQAWRDQVSQVLGNPLHVRVTLTVESEGGV